MPLEKHKRWVRARRVHVELPLFPNYLFVKFNAEEPKWNEIRSVKGVRDILCNQTIRLLSLPALSRKSSTCNGLVYSIEQKSPCRFPQEPRLCSTTKARSLNS